MSDVDLIHAAFGYDTALCDRILVAASMQLPSNGYDEKVNKQSAVD